MTAARALALSAAIALLAAPASGQAERDPLRRTLELLRAASVAERVDPAALQRELAAQGETTIPILFAALDTGILPSGVVEPELYRIPEPVLGAVWASFSGMRAAPARDYAASFASPEVDERTRLTALRLLGGVGTSADLILLGRLAAPKGGPPPSTAAVAAFERALMTLVDREPAGIRWLQDLFEEAYPGLWTPILRSISTARAPDRLIVLASLLGTVSQADPLVLCEIGKLARSDNGTHDEYVRGSVRDYLDSVDDSLVRAAAQTAGYLSDEAAVPDLVGILRDGDPRNATVASAALRAITGCNFGRDADRWEAWHRDEQRFWREESHRWLAGLRGDDSAEVAEALSALSNRRLYRHELANAISTVLDRPEPALRRMACAALGKLDAACVRGQLEPLLRDPVASVREEAKKALSRLSVRTLAPRR